LSKKESDAALIYAMCFWAEENAEHIAAPCQESIALGGGGTVIISWFNPMPYTSLEVYHVNVSNPPFGFVTHLEITLPAGTTSWQTPILQPGDFFVIRGILGDDHSGYAYPGPCV
jgi:hypothetical protein